MSPRVSIRWRFHCSVWQAPRNPACNPATQQVLRRACALEPAERFPTIPQFLDALKAAASLEPATPARMIDVLLGISPDLQSALEKVGPEALPAWWREGGVQVLQDRLLARLVPVSTLPEARA